MFRQQTGEELTDNQKKYDMIAKASNPLATPQQTLAQVLPTISAHAQTAVPLAGPCVQNAWYKD
eukprot:1145159-Pelagomonas_calceolata.AAC.10